MHLSDCFGGIKAREHEGQILPSELIALAAPGAVGAAYQPIVCTRSLETRGFEALARFKATNGRLLRPDIVFSRLHDNPLMLLLVELTAKKAQLAHAPGQGWLFVNLDPDSYEADHDRLLSDLLVRHSRRNSLVVEIIENHSLRDIELTRRMMEELASLGIPLALDDVGTDGGVLSFSVMEDVAFMKLDRYWLTSPHSTRKEDVLSCLLNLARRFGITPILEGIETEAHLQRARHLGIDYIQGFLFKNRFLEAWGAE